MATTKAKIGFVGLGHMGGNMAARFLAAGYTVYGESRDRDEADDLVHQGLEWRDTPSHIGENGQGLVLKLAINISLAVQMLAFAEGLVLAERSGIDPKLAVEVMTGSPIGSPMLKARADLVLDLPDEAWFDVSLMQKDVVLALDAARRLSVPLPSAAAADELLTVARALGYERRDIAALFEVLAHLAGDPVRSPA